MCCVQAFYTSIFYFRLTAYNFHQPRQLDGKLIDVPGVFVFIFFFTCLGSFRWLHLSHTGIHCFCGLVVVFTFDLLECKSFYLFSTSSRLCMQSVMFLFNHCCCFAFANTLHDRAFNSNSQGYCIRLLQLLSFSTGMCSSRVRFHNRILFWSIIICGDGISQARLTTYNKCLQALHPYSCIQIWFLSYTVCYSEHVSRCRWLSHLSHYQFVSEK